MQFKDVTLQDFKDFWVLRFTVFKQLPVAAIWSRHRAQWAGVALVFTGFGSYFGAILVVKNLKHRKRVNNFLHFVCSWIPCLFAKESVAKLQSMCDFCHML